MKYWYTEQQDESQNDAEWKKPDRKENILYKFMKNSRKYHSLVTENRAMVAREGYRWGKRVLMRGEIRGGITKRQEETSGSDGWICYLDYGNGFKTRQCVHFIHVQFIIHWLYLNKAGKKPSLLKTFNRTTIIPVHCSLSPPSPPPQWQPLWTLLGVPLLCRPYST